MTLPPYTLEELWAALLILREKVESLADSDDPAAASLGQEAHYIRRRWPVPKKKANRRTT